MKTALPRIDQGKVLADRIIVSLRKAILDGSFSPGEKLDQALIAEELGVSRTPVREAIMRLEAEGFIEIRPHYGAYIIQVSPQDVYDVFEVRKLLEVEVIRQISPSIPNKVLDELEELVARTKEDSRTGNFSSRFESDVTFHETLIGLAENKIIAEVLDDLANRVTLIRRFAQIHSDSHGISCLDEHLAILQALRKHDAISAARLMANHLEKASRRIGRLAKRNEGHWPELSTELD